MEKYFLTQIKRTNGTFEKGCVVKDSLDAVKQSYHAYLGAYAYGNNKDTDYVQCYVTNLRGGMILSETWDNIPVEPEPDEEATNENV
jgi:hypothetical protein